MRRRMLRAMFGSSLYRYRLRARPPKALALTTEGRWPGEPANATAILRGELRFAGETVRDPAPIWSPPGASEAWLASFHRFGWLADLAALGTPSARETGRMLFRSWLDEHETSWKPLPWRADVLGQRLVAWISHLDDFTTADDPLRPRILGSLARQLRHLGRVAAWEVGGAGRLTALKGLIFGLAATTAGERRIAKVLKLLEREVAAQIKPDGGHVSRCPAVQVAVLSDLIDVRAAIKAVHVAVPGWLQSAIDRAAPMVRFFRHGDGRLAHFNNTAEEYGPHLDLVLTRAEAKGKAPGSAPHSGFQRLTAGRTIVVADTGPAPPPGLDEHAFAGTLSFEMSYGRERLIVNCGAYRGQNPEWRRVPRTTAAHSTLTIGDTNSAEVRPDLTLGRRPVHVACERMEEDGSQWITASHDGYAGPFGLIHRRMLFLSADGEDLRGEDRLNARPGASFTVRFHLHPSVEVSLTDAGALLRLPSGTAFRLRAQGAQVGLAESIYLGTGDMTKSRQVVLSGPVGSQGVTVKWAIRRDNRKPAEE